MRSLPPLKKHYLQIYTFTNTISEPNIFFSHFYHTIFIYYGFFCHFMVQFEIPTTILLLQTLWELLILPTPNKGGEQMSKSCQNCGYQMADVESFCPQCGTQSEPMPQQPNQNQTQFQQPQFQQQPFQQQGGYQQQMNPQQPFTNGATHNSTMNLYCKIGVIAVSILMIIATILPYMETMGLTINLLFPNDETGDGIFFAILAIVAIVLTCLNKKIPVVVCGVIALVLCCYEISQISSLMDSLGGFSSMLSKGIGYYLMIVSSFALPIISAIDLWQSMKNKNNGNM